MAFQPGRVPPPVVSGADPEVEDNPSTEKQREYLANMCSTLVGLNLSDLAAETMRKIDTRLLQLWEQQPQSLNRAVRTDEIVHRDATQLQPLGCFPKDWEVLDKNTASKTISWLKQKVYDSRADQWAQEAKQRAEAKAAAATQKVAQAQQVLLPALVEGLHEYEGRVYKVQRAVHGSGRLYAKVFVPAGPNPQFDGAAQDRNHAVGGKFKKVDNSYNLRGKLTEDTLMELEDAAKWGRLYGTCMICGRTLTDEESISRGIGPICEGRL